MNRPRKESQVPLVVELIEKEVPAVVPAGVDMEDATRDFLAWETRHAHQRPGHPVLAPSVKGLSLYEGSVPL